jgi:hypothetical protein
VAISIASRARLTARERRPLLGRTIPKSVNQRRPHRLQSGVQITAPKYAPLEAGLVSLPAPSPSRPLHQTRVADDIDSEDRGEATTGSATARVRIVLPPAVGLSLHCLVACLVLSQTRLHLPGDPEPSKGNWTGLLPEEPKRAWVEPAPTIGMLAGAGGHNGSCTGYRGK